VIIRSSFEDYYDGQQAYGVDDHVVYERKLRESVLDPRLVQDEELVKYLRFADDDEIQDIALLGFCGRAYPVHSSFDDFAIGQSKSYDWLPSGSLFELEDFAKCWYKIKPNVDGFEIGEEAFVMLGSPAFLVKPRTYGDEWRAYLDIQLKAFHFQRVVNSFDTFVAIRNYWVNVLSKTYDSPVTSGDDKTIARQKGFDDQSFRQEAPGNKKLNRQANRLKKRGTL